ncbi:nucleoside hydrolase-like domain-containing protein [Tautonia plasticadhaerens]|uniref:DUF1593 domain-containing protein n=1 Tax=Tautonia plasticadhaerens TaxID=2527974 RepID=A0A518GX01_9BACT|nr:nucleoside hydrolase-like domain-containing protein [Tautonia plasticadhaerens]QDV33120.1 hypothetical protein ElP_09620 [Tautonia plasticadhaerens]
MNLLGILIGSIAATAPQADGPAPGRPRLVVLTDIGGDPDDMQSMRRLMLYANEFEVVGLVASASGTPGEVGRAVTRPDLIREIIDDYEQVVANLRLHADGYPDPDALRAVVRGGDPERGVSNVGEGRSTGGSELIAGAVEASGRPLHVAIWGGAHDLAQALHDLRSRHPADRLEELLGRVRVYAIADQDKWDSRVQGTGEWIRENFPGLRYVESGPPGSDRFSAAFRGMYQNDSKGRDGPTLPLVTDEVARLGQADWVGRNVRDGHGPIGADYPIVGQNPGTERNTRGLKEGDTPSWFFVLSNGLGDPAEPTFGGWGGRFRHDEGGHFVDAEDEHPNGEGDAGLRRKWTVARWRRAYQHDFAARLDWCVSTRDRANHAPVAAVDGEDGRGFVVREASPGSTVSLDASGSTDPDGDPITYRWWIYREPSDPDSEAMISGEDGPRALVSIPEGATGGTVHVILEVEDGGEPSLVGYRRVLVRVGPGR